MEVPLAAPRLRIPLLVAFGYLSLRFAPSAKSLTPIVVYTPRDDIRGFKT